MSRCNAGRYHNWLIYRPPKAAHITISYSFRIVDGSGELLDSWFSQVPIVPYFYPARILETGTNLFWGRFREMDHLRMRNMSPVEFTIYSNGEFVKLEKFNKEKDFITDGSIIRIGLSAKYTGEVNKWNQWYCHQPTYSMILQQECRPYFTSKNDTNDASIDDPTNNERPIFGQIAVRTTSVSVSSAKDKFEEYASKLLQNFRLLIGDFYTFRAVENQPSQPKVS